MSKLLFGPDIPYESLDPTFKACLPPNKPSDECDQWVGSLKSGLGFCGPDSGYAHMTYCACVNSDLTCPMVTFEQCGNAEKSYKSTSMVQGGAEFEGCSGRALCQQIAKINGDQNVIKGFLQECNPTNNITPSIISANPILAVILFVVLIALIVLVFAGGSGSSAIFGGGSSGVPGRDESDCGCSNMTEVERY